MSTIRVMSQNQWNCTNNLPSWEKQGLDCSAAVRMKGHVKILGELMPDVLGGQEVNKEMQQELIFGCMESGLPYTLIWGNMTPIVYRADKLELLDSRYILYPERVQEYDGCFNDAKSKSCNLAVMRTKEDGKTFIFAATHLWWKNGRDPASASYQEGSDEVRVKQMQQACELIVSYQEKYDCPAILVGDMNAGYDSPAVQLALTEGGFVHAHDVAAETTENIGYNGCGGRGPGTWSDKPFVCGIDHILLKGIPGSGVIRFARYLSDAYRYLSDHAPVYADITL